MSEKLPSVNVLGVVRQASLFPGSSRFAPRRRDACVHHADSLALGSQSLEMGMMPMRGFGFPVMFLLGWKQTEGSAQAESSQCRAGFAAVPSPDAAEGRA